MNISIKNLIGVFVDDDESVKRGIAKLPPLREKELILDFSGCVIDYVATSKIIDKAIEYLESIDSSTEGSKLELIYDVLFHERLFLKWFFFGSERLQLDKKTAGDEQIRNSVVQGMKYRCIKLQISIYNSPDDESPTIFTYES